MNVPCKKLAIVFLSLAVISCDRQEKEQVVPTPPKNVQQVAQTPAPSPLLDLVPADTVFFSGVSQPFPLQSLIQWYGKHFTFPDSSQYQELFQLLDQEANKPGERMFLQVWNAYVEAMQEPTRFLDDWGFGESPVFASYALGLSPVLLRISLDDVQKFEQKVEALEAAAGLEVRPENLGTARYRAYSLDEEQAVQFIIGVDGQDAVFLVDTGIDSEQTLSLALGQSKPERSLAQSERLSALQKQYGLHSSWLAYLDHQQIITGLTSPDGNRLAKMLHTFAAQDQDLAQTLASLQTEGCRKDLKSLAEQWPETVMGYTTLDLQSQQSRIASRLIIANRDKALMEGLHSLRGFVPDYSSTAFAPTAFAFAFGLSVEKLAPFLTQQWTEISQKQYSCSLLQEMQKEVKGNNPAMLQMATAMATGIRGLSFNLQDFNLGEVDPEDNDLPLPEDLDALMSISAQNPSVLVQTVAAFFPPLAALDLPADGTPADLPLPFPLPFTPKLAINGSHITLYVGPKAAGIAQDLGKASLASSPGILAGLIDYSQYYKLLGDALPQMLEAGLTQDTQQVQSFLDTMKDAKVRLQVHVDFTEQGIEMNADIFPSEHK
jgi:hypothetical protein